MKINNVTFFGKSETGRRKQNEDNFIVFANKFNFIIAAVADGMGGHFGGKIASLETIKTIKEFFWEIDFKFFQQKDVEQTLIQSVKLISKKLQLLAEKDKELMDMGTTLNLNVIIDDLVYTLNVGDSRVMIYARKELKQISEDHNLAAIAKKDITLKNYESFSNYLTSCIGPKKVTKIDIYKTNLASNGEIIIITSDGIHGVLNENEILCIMKEDTNIEAKTFKLINDSFKKGSTDNMTCIMVKYGI